MIGIVNRSAATGGIADDQIKMSFRNSDFLKAFEDDRCGWAKRFRNLSGCGIQFNACHTDMSSKRGRHQSNEVTGADRGIQDTSTLESEPSKRCIDRFYNRLRGIVRILR